MWCVNPGSLHSLCLPVYILSTRFILVHVTKGQPLSILYMSRAVWCVLFFCCSLLQRRTSRYKGNVNVHSNAQNGWCNRFCQCFFSSSRLWSRSHFVAVASCAPASHMQTLPTVSVPAAPRGEFKRTLWLFVFDRSCRGTIQLFLSNILSEPHNLRLILYSLPEACLRSTSQSEVCCAVMVLYSCFIDTISYSKKIQLLIVKLCRSDINGTAKDPRNGFNPLARINARIKSSLSCCDMW